MSVIADTVYERIQEVESQRAELDDELAALLEIHEIARTRLNGDRPVSPAQTSRQATPSGPTQPPANPPERKRASRSAPKKKSTSARRRPAPAQQPSAENPDEAAIPADKVHTASGAPAGGRRHSYDAAEILEKTRDVFAGADGPLSASEVARRLDFVKGNDRALAAVRQAILELVGERFIAEASTRARGGGLLYERPKSEERAMPLPPGSTSEGSALVDGLLDQIVEELETDGGRVSRADLKKRLGDPDPEDFSLAVDRAVTLNKVTRTKVGGVAGYELAR